MRKKIAAFLAALLCLTAFTGCSQAEMSYLKMGVDMLKDMKVVEASGTTTIKADFDNMKSFVIDVAKTAGATDEQVEASVAEMGDLKGEKEIKLDYKMKMDMDTLNYFMDVDVIYGGTRYAMGDMYYSMTDGIYVSTETLWGAYQLSKNIFTDTESSFFYNEDFAKELKANLDADKYICLMSMAELGMTEEEMASVFPEGGFSSLYDSVYKFYTEAFKDFTTNGMITEVSGGYRMKADGKAVAQLLVDTLKYIGNNPDTFMAATTTYLVDVMKSTNVPEEDIAAFEAELTFADEDMAEVTAVMQQLSNSLEMAIANPAVEKALDSFSYDSTMTKDDKTYSAKENMNVVYNGKNVLSVVSDSKTVPSSGKISMPTASVTPDEISNDLYTLVDKYNPVTGVTVIWSNAEGNGAMMSQDRTEVFPLTDRTVMTSYMVQEGRVYLPLRDVCEAMGETVEWDKAERTSYIMNGTEKVVMEGIMEGGKSFVMLRDFEKLGYAVDYRSVEGVKEATVAKV